MPEKLTKHKKLKAKRKHGFLKRSKTHNGKKMNKRRSLKGRKKI